MAYNEYENQKYNNREYDNFSLEDSTFIECNFTHCSFYSCTLINCSFINCTFTNCTIADLKHKYTDGMNNTFISCRIIGIDWKDLEKKGSIALPFTILDHCSLTYNNFYKLKMNKYDFKESSLEGSYFTECQLKESNFRGCNLKGCSFTNTNLQGADFRFADNYAFEINTNYIKAAKFSFPEVVGLLSSLEIIIE